MQSLLDDDQLGGGAGYADVTAGAEQVRTMAQQQAGRLGYATYGRVRAQAVAEAFATSLAGELGFPAESNRASFMAAAFGAWARRPEVWQADTPEAIEDRLGTIDIPFRLRRAEFVLQAINDLFTDADPGMRAELATVKSKCWDLITELRAVQQRVAVEISAEAMALFGPRALTQEGYLADPAAFAGTGPGGHDADLRRLYEACVQAVGQAVTGSSQGLWETLTGRTQGWDARVRARLLPRYVGFPIWDALTFPVISLARLPQLKQIGVQRFSPLDATCLKAVDSDGERKTDPRAKLDGTAIRHFGAFFERAWRENDYLWGRLDGAELIMRLLGRQSARPDGEPAADLTGALRSALRAILDAEQASLTKIDPVCQALAGQVKDIKTM